MTHTASRAQEVSALLADGSTVRLRPACPQDRRQVLRLYEEMSADNLRSRFFVVSRRSGEQAADRLCAPPGPGHRTLVAVHGDRLIGTAEYETADDPASAEIALAVADDFHQRGVGTLLLEHLVHVARENGIAVFTADVLADNHLIHKVFADLGLRVTRQYDGTTVRGTIRLAPDERYLSALDIRGRTADTASLRPLLRPHSIAVIGAGTRPGSVGRAILHNLREAHFAGLLYAVNPHAHAVLCVPAYPSVAALPHLPDLAVIAIPAAGVPEAAVQCGRAGCQSAGGRDIRSRRGAERGADRGLPPLGHADGRPQLPGHRQYGRAGPHGRDLRRHRAAAGHRRGRRAVRRRRHRAPRRTLPPGHRHLQLRLAR